MTKKGIFKKSRLGSVIVHERVTTRIWELLVLIGSVVGVFISATTNALLSGGMQWVVVLTVGAGITTLGLSIAVWRAAVEMHRHTKGLSENLAASRVRPVEDWVARLAAQIETEGREILDEPATATIITIRKGLFDAGIWNAEDVKEFDLALKVRNAIVHGDAVSPKELSRAAWMLANLREGLGSSSKA